MNMYSRPENVARVDRSVDRIRVRSIASPIVRPIARPAPVPDDVFAGKDGKVYRRDPKGTWQVRTGTKWKPTTLPTPPATPLPQEREAESFPSTRHSQRDVSRERNDPAVEHAAPQRINPRERPTPPREEPTPPTERPAPSRERPTPPSERPSPSRERPTPGDLEREYHARQRSDKGDDSDTPPPAARPEPPQKESRSPTREEEPQKERPQQRSREDESQKERPQQRSNENARPERNR
jgi:hypothetical protein